MHNCSRACLSIRRNIYDDFQPPEREVGKTKKLNKWVLHEMSNNQKKCCYQVSSSLLLHNKHNPFLNWIVTCNEKWMLYDNRQHSAKWLDTNKAPQHFPKPQLHQKKVMLTVWWSAASLIHHSFLNAGKTITAEKYCQQIAKIQRNLENSQH